MAAFTPGHWVRQVGVKDARFHLVNDTQDGEPVIHGSKPLKDQGHGFEEVASPLDPADACHTCQQVASRPAEE